jgi:hypothetical protein
MAAWQDAVFYSTENVGAAFATPSGESKRAALYSVENVGVGLTRPNNESKVANQYILENVGVGWRKPDDASANANLYSEFNALDEVLIDGPLWVEAANGEVMWEPGLVYNGCDFVRYHMWDGNCWQASTVEAEEQIFPTAVSTYYNGTDYTSSITVPAFPTGMTSAVGLVVTAASNTINLPAGWTLLGSTQVLGATGGGGGTSNIRRCIAVSIDNPTGLEDRTFTLGALIGDPYNGGGYAMAYFTGGKPGGTWIANKGEELSHTSQGRFPPVTTTDGGPNLWWQAGVITAIYTSFSAPPGVAGSHNGFVEPWIYPTSASGETFRSTFLNARPYFWPDFIDTNNIGAYGSPCSTSWGFKWTPPSAC